MDHARWLADHLKSIELNAAYSSDLQRSLATAETILSGSATAGQRLCRPQVRTDRRLREIRAGLWEMLSFDEARRLYPVEYAEHERDLIGYRFPGGESFRDLERRVLDAFRDILGQGRRSVLLVGHQGVNRVLLCHLLGLPLEKLFSVRQDYGAVSLIEAAVRPDGRLTAEVRTLHAGWAG